MRPLTFSPGPSKISPDTYTDIQSAIESGYLEYSHRSQAFYDVSATCIENLKKYLQIPTEYNVLFLDSATSAWHSMVANTVESKSTHLVNGAFSLKAKQASDLLYKETTSISVYPGKSFDIDKINISVDTELVTACYNESSTGVTMTIKQLKILRANTSQQLLAVDATSIAAAAELPIELADIWYFSVQKGFGLPAGLGVIILSPRAYERSLSLEASGGNLAGVWRWSLGVRAQEKQAGQTIHTPNMLGVYLLNESVKRYLEFGGIKQIEAKIREKAERIWQLVDNNTNLEHFVKDKEHRSPTVITIVADENYIADLHAAAKTKNVVLGKGYGELKNSTFRVANFPAITDSDIDKLAAILG